MNTFLKYGLAAVIAAIASYNLLADQTISTNKPAISVFIIPTEVSQGRDPFYPESSRLYQNTSATNRPAAEAANLTVKGVSAQSGTQLVIINNHTFAPGDAGDVITPNGRVHIRCLEIQSTGVLIEVNGQKRELHF